MKITGIAGSLRVGSHSRALLAEISALLPEGTDYQTLDIGAFPHYDEDLDHSGAPQSVISAKARIAASQGVLIVTPEFNHGLPGVLKNALDWLSRPVFGSVFAGKTVLFATQSPGALGGVRAQYQLRETLASMLADLVPYPEIAVTFVEKKLVGGKLVDEPTRAHIAKGVARFVGALKPEA